MSRLIICLLIAFPMLFTVALAGCSDNLTPSESSTATPSSEPTSTLALIPTVTLAVSTPELPPTSLPISESASTLTETPESAAFRTAKSDVDTGRSTGNTFMSVSAGLFHTCGVRPDGTVECWGKDFDGQSSPPGGSFSSISARGFHTCGVRLDGTVECWGES